MLESRRSKRCAESLKLISGQAQSGCTRMAPEAADQARLAGIDVDQQITHMDPGRAAA